MATLEASVKAFIDEQISLTAARHKVKVSQVDHQTSGVPADYDTAFACTVTVSTWVKERAGFTHTVNNRSFVRSDEG